MISDIGRLLGPARVLEDEPARLSSARDSWPQALGWTQEELRRRMPAAVLKPRDDGGVSAVLAWAAAEGFSVVPRGAGSGVLGAAVPQGPKTVVLDLSGLTERFEIDARPGRPAVVCGAGMLGSDLEARLQGRGWSLMHFPQSMEDSSAGGWIATDSFGQFSTRYGGVKDQALWVKAALPDGGWRTEEAAPHLGAEGTLGVITEVALRVRQAARSRKFHAFRFKTLGSALDFAAGTMARPVAPSVLRLYCPTDAFFNGLRRGRGTGTASSTWMEAAQSLMLRRTRLLYALSPLVGRHWIAIVIYEEEPGFEGNAPARTAAGASIGEGPALRWWERRYLLDRERLERVFQRGCFADTLDLWAPWAKLAELHRAVLSALRPHAFAFSHLSHFDHRGACLYVTLAGSGAQDHAEAWSSAMDAAVRTGGSVNHHHGVGLAKLPWLQWARDADWRASWRAEKTRRDPKGMLNPGKLCQ